MPETPTLTPLLGHPVTRFNPLDILLIIDADAQVTLYAPGQSVALTAMALRTVADMINPPHGRRPETRERLWSILGDLVEVMDQDAIAPAELAPIAGSLRVAVESL